MLYQTLFFRPQSLLVGLLIAMGLVFSTATLAQDKEEDKPKPKGPPPTPVVVAPVLEIMESPKYTYNGFMEPVKKAIVTAVEPGFVKSVRVRSGAKVKKGEVLAVLTSPSMLLDLDVLQAQYREAEAQLSQANIKMKRQQSLYEKKLIPAEQYENEKAAIQVIEARVTTSRTLANRLRSKLKMMVLRAPIDGQVVSANIDVGQWITSNKEIYEISNFDRFNLFVGLPGKYIGSVPAKASVQVYIPEIKQTMRGKIHAVIQHVDAATGNFRLKIRINNPKKLPLSGLVGQATVPVGPKNKVKTVPRDAIVRRGTTTQVVVIRENVAQIVPVQVQGNLENSVIIMAESLAVDEIVVVRGNERLFPGTTVKISEPE